MSKRVSIDNGASTVAVGEWVGFKAGIETYGKVIAIRGSTLVIECRDERTEQSYAVEKQASRCWAE